MKWNQLVYVRSNIALASLMYVIYCLTIWKLKIIPLKNTQLFSFMFLCKWQHSFAVVACVYLYIMMVFTWFLCNQILQNIHSYRDFNRSQFLSLLSSLGENTAGIKSLFYQLCSHIYRYQGKQNLWK